MYFVKMHEVKNIQFLFKNQTFISQ